MEEQVISTAEKVGTSWNDTLFRRSPFLQNNEKRVFYILRDDFINI